MNVIFDQEVAQKLKERYTVLELDTVMQPLLTKPLVLYAVIEVTDITALASRTFFTETHANMVAAYKNSDWSVAQELAVSLLGQWQGELDEFYNLVIDFSQECAKLNKTWDGIRHTIPVEGHIIED
jgi:hypothetical protein